MNKKGLLEEPKFDKPEFYLTSGERTGVTPAIQEFADSVKGHTDLGIAINILSEMNKKLAKLKNLGDPRKFRRTADEILRSGERTGCCDSSTLFVALARARGIPAMQIITVKSKDALENPTGFRSGHYFSAVYLKGRDGNGEWRVIDTYNTARSVERIALPFDLEDRNFVAPHGDMFYAIAYTRDYSDIRVGDKKINSSDNMLALQKEAFGRCDRTNVKCSLPKKDRDEDKER